MAAFDICVATMPGKTLDGVSLSRCASSQTRALQVIFSGPSSAAVARVKLSAAAFEAE
jgi:hypothetical protein